MTLVEKINLLKSVIADLKDETALALTIQGLYTEAKNISLKDIPDLILQIRVYDFNYKFDFKALDSVGTIHSRNEGIATGGMKISPVPFNFRIADRMDFKTLTTITPRLSGVYGQDSSISVNCVFPTITYHKIDFKAVDSVPEKFIAPSEENE